MNYNPVETYLQEAEDLLAEIEQAALTLGGENSPAETIHQLFRAFHTIKGSGAMFGMERVAGFTHHVETALDRVREGVIPVTPKLAELVLAAQDHIRLLLAAERGQPMPPPGQGEELIAMFGALTGCEGSVVASPAPAGQEDPHDRVWSICFQPHPQLLAFGGNPLLLFHDLAQLGAVEILAHTDNIPDLDEIQPDVCYLWWSITLRTAAGQDAIRDVFIFVEDGSNLEIKPLEDVVLSPGSGPAPVEAAPIPPSAEQQPRPVADVVRKATAKDSTVRVPATRLDRLVNLVGELVMNQSRLSQAASESGAPELANPVQELERLVAELRDDVLSIRMLPIGTLFGRFPRLVHDLSAELGKEADLITEGAETELDKSILDQLGEPMVHCLRNCLDHGIEPPAERLEKGKPHRAAIRLSAAHRGSDVVISIQDDGRGIDRAAVLAKAVEKRLVVPDACLSDKDILNLILMPGFSTARQVTSVSGRGVGMDAVKRQIDALRGSLSLTSESGKGTRVSITLPLTLAIIEGLLVQVGSDQFIIPLAAVTENVELTRGERRRNNGRNVIAVRGELVPYIDLRSAFRIEGEVRAIAKVVIVQHEGDRVGLVVDRVLGTHQTVIQSLGRFFRNIEVVSGATIMGDGRVALIMDTAAIVRYVDADKSAAMLAVDGGGEHRPALA